MSTVKTRLVATKAVFSRSFWEEKCFLKLKNSISGVKTSHSQCERHSDLATHNVNVTNSDLELRLDPLQHGLLWVENETETETEMAVIHAAGSPYN